MAITFGRIGEGAQALSNGLNDMAAGAAEARLMQAQQRALAQQQADQREAEAAQQRQHREAQATWMRQVSQPQMVMQGPQSFDLDAMKAKLRAIGQKAMGGR